MNLPPIWSGSVAVLLDASIGLALVVKYTVVLALAWLTHWLLTGHNPRWRAALWRAAVVGIGVVSVLACSPPIMKWPLVRAQPAPIEQPAELSQLNLAVGGIQAVPVLIPRTPRQEGRHWASASTKGASRSKPQNDGVRVPAEEDRLALSSPALARTSGGIRATAVAGPRLAELARAEARGFRWSRWAGWWFLSIWAAGVFILVARLMLACVHLSRLVRRSADAPDWIVQECRAIAGRLGCLDAVRVRQSVEISTPCLTGLWRPVLLLPEQQCLAGDWNDMRAILAHELAHDRGHDLHWNLAAHLTSILLWFHPLCLRVRAAHASACDAVSDAVAADFLGDVTSYGRTLARLAVQVAWPPPAHGLAMAHTSDVRCRLDALNRKVFRSPLSWKLVMPAMLVTSMLLVLIGGFGFTRAEQSNGGKKALPGSETKKAETHGPRALPTQVASKAEADDAEKPATAKKAGKLTFRAVAAETNQPIEGVSIRYQGKFGGKSQHGTVATGRDGAAVIEWMPKATVQKLWITARKPKLASIHILWDDERHPVELPATKELRFVPGTVISGVVRDEAGHPIEGAAVNYADASSVEFAKSSKLVLQPWGKIEGDVRIGRQPGSNQEVMFQPTRPARGLYVFDYGYTTRTDDRGRFTFDRVVPGPGIVSRVVVTEFAGGSSQHMPGWEEYLEVEPGQTAKVRIGGKGRPVIGRVVLDGTPEVPTEWTQNQPATMSPLPGERNLRPSRYVRFGSNLDKDGRFRIDDVPIGKYELKVPVNTAPDPRFCGAGTEIGAATMTVTVPEIKGGRPDEPLDLGTITAKLSATLKAGDLAPAFTVQRLAGKGRVDQLKLSDERGKLVLLDFWATWCGPCLAEMPATKDIQQTFGGDSRFRLISLSCDQTAEVAERYIKENGLSWTHGFVGNLAAGVAVDYKVRAIPATLLVGPDGRILAKNQRGAALMQAVQNALKNEQLFSGAKTTTRPPRFPLTRFEAPEGKPADQRPEVVVLDDCDEDFKAGHPHHDALRLLSTTGRGVHTTFLREFNTCQTIGAIHCVAIDAARGRIYLSELAGNRVTALDVSGRKLWQAAEIKAHALAVDPKTGHLWCTVGGNLSVGETVVLDGTGQEVTSFPVRGIDIVHDPHTDGFWLVGDEITKLSREGQVLFHKPREGWAHVSVAVNPRDGSVWIVERAHRQVARSENRLWHLDSSGSVIKMWTLAEKHPFAVACEPKTGTAWVVNMGAEILRFTANGNELPPLPVKARAIGISPTTGQVWVTTETEILRLDAAGKPTTVSRFETTSGQSWLAAF